MIEPSRRASVVEERLERALTDGRGAITVVLPDARTPVEIGPDATHPCSVRRWATRLRPPAHVERNRPVPGTVLPDDGTLAAAAADRDVNGSDSSSTRDAPVGQPAPAPGWSGPGEARFAEFRAGLETDAGLLDAARAAGRAAGVALAEQARALAAFAARRPASLDLPDGAVGAAARQSRQRRPDALAAISEFCVDEVAASLTISGHRAEQLVVEAVLLVDRLPAVLDAVTAGDLTWEHARVAGDLLGGLSAELRDRAQAELVAKAAGRTPQQWRGIVRRWVMRSDADAISRRVTEAVRARTVAVYPGADGMGTLSARLPLPVARAVEDALRRYARAAATPDDPRSAGERMADCLVSLVLDPGGHGMSPVQAHLTVVAAVQTLLGGDEPGEVAGDVVPAAMVRDLARSLGLLPEQEPPGQSTDDAPPGDADRTALAGVLSTRTTAGTGLAGIPRVAVADEVTGALLALTDAAGIRRALREGVGLGPPPPTERYRPSAPLDAFVRLRDRRCQFPGCRVRAGVCDVDHQQPYLRGGPTAACNLACLCEHHHRLSHQAPGWRMHRSSDGTGLTWTTPTGRTVTTRPPPIHPAGGPEPVRHDNPSPDAAMRDGMRDAVRRFGGSSRSSADPGDDPPPF